MPRTTLSCPGLTALNNHLLGALSDQCHHSLHVAISILPFWIDFWITDTHALRQACTKVLTLFNHGCPIPGGFPGQAARGPGLIHCRQPAHRGMGLGGSGGLSNTLSIAPNPKAVRGSRSTGDITRLHDKARSTLSMTAFSTAGHPALQGSAQHSAPHVRTPIAASRGHSTSAAAAPQAPRPPAPRTPTAPRRPAAAIGGSHRPQPRARGRSPAAGPAPPPRPLYAPRRPRLWRKSLQTLPVPSASQGILGLVVPDVPGCCHVRGCAWRRWAGGSEARSCEGRYGVGLGWGSGLVLRAGVGARPRCVSDGVGGGVWAILKAAAQLGLLRGSWDGFWRAVICLWGHCLSVRAFFALLRCSRFRLCPHRKCCWFEVMGKVCLSSLRTLGVGQVMISDSKCWLQAWTSPSCRGPGPQCSPEVQQEDKASPYCLWSWTQAWVLWPHMGARELAAAAGTHPGDEEAPRCSRGWNGSG